LRLAIESLECERQCRIFGAGEVHHVGKDRTLPPFKLRCSERSTCSHTTAQDAAKAAIAFLKNLDDIREISVEQVTPQVIKIARQEAAAAAT
jgi:hypothetical protein